ncbi:MAG: hypothetical protein LBD31_03870 [Treponema sp.]|jgi:hypothetical protein|nr:hypothetical protein [Treponema sp.]
MKPQIRHLFFAGLLIPFILLSCKTTGGTAAPGAGITDGGLTGDTEDISGDVTLETLEAAREAALAAGAQDLVPDRFSQADTQGGLARELNDKGDRKGFLREALDAQDRYQILTLIAQAHAKQQEADENDFFSRDPDNYMLAATAGNKAVEFYDDGSLAEARETAAEALERFTQVVHNGWVALVEEWAANASEMRAAAQEARADVAVRQDFNAAEQVYNQAHTARRAEEYAAAGELFKQAADLFAAVLAQTAAKRQRAEETLRQAEQKVEESGKKAQEAEEIIGGGE